MSLGSPNKEKEVGVTCGTHEDEKIVQKVLVGKPEGKRPLGKPTRRSKVGIKIYLREIIRGGGQGMGSPG
jgi:hypothetical protein